MKKLSKNIYSLALLTGFVIPIISMVSCTKTDNKNNEQDSKKDINVEFSKDKNYEITGPTTISRSNILGVLLIFLILFQVQLCYLHRNNYKVRRF